MTWLSKNSTEGDIRAALDRCQSKLERDLLVEILQALPENNRVCTQYEVRVPASGIRLGVVDFMIENEWGGLVAIELDGHEFHEKTKDQARRDRRRDRSLIACCYGPLAIVRFTGSEVFAEPAGCAAEAIDLAFQVGAKVLSFALERLGAKVDP